MKNGTAFAVPFIFSPGDSTGLDSFRRMVYPFQSNTTYNRTHRSSIPRIDHFRDNPYHRCLAAGSRL
jgi:hypothetical protein